MKTTKPDEKHDCLAVGALEELLRALELVAMRAVECGERDLAASLNLLVIGAKAMAENEDE